MDSDASTHFPFKDVYSHWKSTSRLKDDAFGENYKYLCDQARKALFGIHTKYP